MRRQTGQFVALRLAEKMPAGAGRAPCSAWTASPVRSFRRCPAGRRRRPRSTASGPKPLVTATTVTEPGRAPARSIRAWTWRAFQPRATVGAPKAGVSAPKAGAQRPRRPWNVSGGAAAAEAPYHGGLTAWSPPARQDQWSPEQCVQIPAFATRAAPARSRARTAAGRSRAGKPSIDRPQPGRRRTTSRGPVAENR